MDSQTLSDALDVHQDVIRLSPQLVPRFYAHGGRLGQGDATSQPERWICSSTPIHPADLAKGDAPAPGLSTCPDLQGVTLRSLLSEATLGPRLLGDERYTQHKGLFRVLVKILDAKDPIPLHVHASDAFIKKNPKVYPDWPLGKDEAYHFLDGSKGDCPYLHLGLLTGVDAKTLVAAMRKGADHVLELSGVLPQIYGQGMMVKAGIPHRPGTALTLEIQQPSDLGTFFQAESRQKPLPASLLHPGFETIEEAAEKVIEWELSTNPKLLSQSQLLPSDASGFPQDGGKSQWIFPPGASSKFSGLKLTVDTKITLKVQQPFALLVWKGQGTLDTRPIDASAGKPGSADEFFIGLPAAKRGIELVNTGDTPLTLFALFAEAL